MDTTSDPSLLFSLLPLLFIGVLMAVPAYMLAIEKGRNPWKWSILCLIPLVNVACMWYFVGTPGSRLERKIDDLLAHTRSEKVS
jgi:hypothetical protein